MIWRTLFTETFCSSIQNTGKHYLTAFFTFYLDKKVEREKILHLGKIEINQKVMLERRTSGVY